MDRIWLKSYPAGMPAEIDADRFDSIPDMLAQTVARFADRPAFHNLGHTLTYAALDRLSRDFAASCSSCRVWARASASPSCRRTCCNIRWRCSASCEPA